MVSLGSLCLSITPSTADLTLPLFSISRGVEAAGFPQQRRVVGENEWEFLAFFLMGIVCLYSAFCFSLLSSSP